MELLWELTVVPYIKHLPEFLAGKNVRYYKAQLFFPSISSLEVSVSREGMTLPLTWEFFFEDFLKTRHESRHSKGLKADTSLSLLVISASQQCSLHSPGLGFGGLVFFFLFLFWLFSCVWSHWNGNAELLPRRVLFSVSSESAWDLRLSGGLHKGYSNLPRWEGQTAKTSRRRGCLSPNRSQLC